jgi:glycosyltransferase involved in cell wall biosynthesis
LTKRIAIVDAGSFVLPYDYQLVMALVRRGMAVDFYGSRTRYNGEFLDALRQADGVEVDAAAISGSVAPRWKGLLAYIGLLARLLLNSRRYRAINLQFIGSLAIALPVLFVLRHKLVFTVHNAVPHDFSGERHRPTWWIARLARSLVFVSEFSRDDFMRRYGKGFLAKSTVLPHGLLPVAPQSGVVDYEDAAATEALVFWSTVKPYKGVELFADLARDERIRGRGLALEIFGAWAAELLPLADELRGLGVKVHDGYLGEAELLAMLQRPVVFLLPYQRASQSGALYSLLNHGRIFICSDVGDLGTFMRRHGLGGLVLKDRSAQAVVDCLDHLAANRETVLACFRRAQREFAWDRLMADCGSAFEP